MIEQQLPDVDTPQAYDDVITTARTRARRRTTLAVAAAAIVAAALALVGLDALDHGTKKPEIVRPPLSAGNWLLAETADGLTFIGPDGATRPAPDPKGTFARWSPDGKRVAYVLPAADDSSRDLVTVDMTTGTRTIAAHCTGCKVTGADWSPDGEQLAYGVLLPDESNELRVLAAGRTGVMARLGAYVGGWPAWSPDGRTIALAENRDDGAVSFVDIVSVDRSSATGLPTAGTPRRIAGPLEGIKRVSWKPDSTQLAFTAGASSMDALKPADLYVVRADGTGLRQVTHNTRYLRMFAVEWENDDPAMPFLVAIVNGEDYTAANLARVSLDGTNVQPLYRGGAPVKAYRATFRY